MCAFSAKWRNTTGPRSPSARLHQNPGITNGLGLVNTSHHVKTISHTQPRQPHQKGDNCRLQDGHGRFSFFWRVRKCRIVVPVCRATPPPHPLHPSFSTPSPLFFTLPPLVSLPRFVFLSFFGATFPSWLIEQNSLAHN